MNNFPIQRKILLPSTICLALSKGAGLLFHLISHSLLTLLSISISTTLGTSVPPPSVSFSSLPSAAYLPSPSPRHPRASFSSLSQPPSLLPPLFPPNSTCSRCASLDSRGTNCLAGTCTGTFCPDGSPYCRHCDVICIHKNKLWSAKDGFCKASGGQCKNNTNICLGSYSRGMCGGPAARQCCLPKKQFSIKPTFFVIHIVLLIPIVIVNMTVITIIIIDSDLHNVPNICIFSLAIGDLLLGILWTCVEIIDYVNQKLITVVNTNFRIFLDLAHICQVAIIFNILLLTIDRFIAINFPLRHYIWSRNGIITKKKTIMACIFAWCLATGLSYSRRINGEWTNCKRSIIFNSIRSLAPLLFTAILNMMIFHVIKNKVPISTAMERQRNLDMDLAQDEPGQHKMCFPITFTTQNKKAAWTVSLILICIFVAYFPHTITVVLSVCGQTSSGFYASLDPYFVLGMLINSLVNPVIYAVTTDQFKSSFLRIVLRRSSNSA